MDQATLKSILRTAESNVRGYARDEGGANSADLLAKAEQANKMMTTVADQLNGQGAFEKVPEPIRQEFVTQAVQSASIEAITSGQALDEAVLKKNLETELANSQAIKVLQARTAPAAGGGIQRGADGRRKLRGEGVTTVGANYGGNE